ncbi:Oxygen-independent coproporphyrinogen-III oxidase 1 [Corynebacterium ciconiae DSM 44920]|uniref:radical SAM family heme chaperone HemW n=1 Tax=Corynebacterium ciconiae TaxID=227319 RepID=UPI00047540E5|nr:radical SAM family heme chaperone HemW [Corynebacterium ciconiae]WKD60663.1 Oxygen-independent coproporphyrinogen-III oxidase 1 [Corynebacterium ciconiae DSM 44920]
MSTFGVYIHVPFCATRCGYCDFNTYTPGELGSDSSPEAYLSALATELRLSAAATSHRRVDTVFVGGGTPSLLGAEKLGSILQMIRDHYELAEDAEITTESNPESTSASYFEQLRAAGFTRVSLGMQSASEKVLATLDRTHTPGRAARAAEQARAAGFEHVNLDMIYGTPGESDDDVRLTLETVLGAGVDHVSAYALIVEPNTKMGRLVRTGQLPAPDDDVMARRYELIAHSLEAAGFDWYEVSNWARPGGECRHNIGYWTDADFWGAGPGAHSHLGDRRFFNVKHPRTYYQRLGQGELPIQESEQLSAAERHTEKVMLGLRLREGIALDTLGPSAAPMIERYVERQLLSVDKHRLTLSDQGRLLADGIIADLLLAEEGH